ncbi:cell division protein FtsQ/DivIB [Luteolibacter algae]|uniref:Cell division protein FtsQ/DivIB n=1 Tax=Luteolibacter algae TaxID=454151 RepID=A0ABW5DDD1_9BACT
MRKKTSRTRRHRHHVKVLKSEVMSPRIAWFNFLSFLKVVGKLAFTFVLLGALAYGIRQAIEHSFHRNPDFRLQAIKLNHNDILDEPALVEFLDIDLAGNIFDFDTDFMEQRLLDIPGISAAHIKRRLPGTLAFEISTRKPVAWIACPEENFPYNRSQSAMLVDYEGYVYPCPPGQVSMAEKLPVFHLAPDPAHPLRQEANIDHPHYKHCLRLLKSFANRYPSDIAMIESISQENEWSLLLKTRSGTMATFGLGDHKRQLDYFSRALHHAHKKGYQIATINLIPKRNVPITVRGDDRPPRAIPVSEDSLSDTGESQRTTDLRSLLNRN